MSQLKDQYPNAIDPNLRVDILPRGAGPLKGGVSGVTYRAGSSNPGGVVRGGRSQGRTPYIVLEQGDDPTTTRNALLHEVGHAMEPFLIRTPDRALAFSQAFSKSGKKVPSWLDPSKNPVPFKDSRGFTYPHAPVDRYGMSFGQGRNMGLSPVEYYANLLSGQLGTPRGSQLTPQGTSILAQHNVTPAVDINPATYQRLLSQGLIPKPFVPHGSDIQLGS